MSEDEIAEMRREAKAVLDTLPILSETTARIYRNCFKRRWRGIEPEEALKIGGGE